MASTRQRGKTYTGYWRNAQGAQKTKGGFATEKEALTYARGEEALAARPIVVDAPPRKRGKLTVAGYMPAFLDGHRLSPTGRASYTQMSKRIIKGLGHKTLAELEPADIRAFIRKQETEVSGATVGHVLTVLREMVKTAVSDQLMARDITADVKVERRDERTMIIATPTQAKAIRLAAPEFYRLLIATMFGSGARWSELMGLQASDIKGSVIQIRRTLVEVNGKPVIQDHGKTKNATRKIPIDPELASRLRELGESHAEGWVFRAPRGGFLSRANFRRIWVPACVAAGIPGLRVHDTRHSHISWLANDPMVPLAAVRDRAGHSSLAVTSRYVHVMAQDEDPCLRSLSVALRAA
jgi:integrase